MSAVLSICRTLLFGATILFAGAGIESAGAQGTDNHRFCDADRPNVVLYLDVTSPYDDIDRTTLIDGVRRIFEGLEGGERVSIRTIEAAFSSSHRLVEVCVPYCKGNGFFDDLFSTCTEGVVINEKKHIRATIEQQIGTVLRNEELPYSEIIRTMTRSAPEEFKEGRENRFFIFSDLVENSEFMPGKRFLTEVNTKLMAALRDDHLIPNLNQATIQVFGFGRGGSKSALTQDKLDKIDEFWTLYFLEAGATISIQQHLAE